MPSVFRFRPAVIALGSAAALVSALAGSVRAQTITFTNIANSTSNEFGSPISAVVNTAGTVAFHANRDVGGTGLYKATNSSGFTTVALDTSAEFASFGTHISINDAGTVAFVAVRDVPGQGVYKATDSSSFTTVALTTSPEFSQFRDQAINAGGTVAFLAARDAGGLGVYKATDASAFTTVAQTTSPEFSGFDDTVTVNTAGVVAFAASRDAGGTGIYTATDSSGFTTIARDTSPEFSDVFSSTAGRPSINDSGRVAFLAGRDAGGSGVYTATDSSGFTTIALSTSPEFSGFFYPTVNNLGTVVFVASRDAGGSGIYAKLSSAAAPVAVIRTGDTLFGSTVQAAIFDRGLAPGSDTVAFTYFLSNGVSGVARASISAAAPEPGTFALLALGALSVAAPVVRRRKAGGR